MSKRKSRYAVKNDNIHRIGFHVIPKNEKQDLLIQSIKMNPITVTIGCAGTGKTYCSTGTVAQLFMKGKYKRIVLTRANVPTGKSLGHFPGSIQEKMTPWLLPMLEVWQGHYSPTFYFSLWFNRPVGFIQERPVNVTCEVTQCLTIRCHFRRHCNVR